MYKPTDFIPSDLKIKSWNDLKPYFDRLIHSEINNADDLNDLILNYSETLSVFHEQNAWSYINMSCETDNQDYVKRYQLFSTKISPELEKASNAVEKKIYNHPEFENLPDDRFGQLKQKLQRELELFREANVELSAEISKLSTKYDQLSGGLTVTLDGEEMPLPKAAVRLQSSDREKRKAAWLAINEKRFSVKDEADNIYNDMLKLRVQTAKNAGYANFRDFRHDLLQRFDYTPQDAINFQLAVEEFIVPLAREIDASRRDKLGLTDDYRPWDTAGEPAGQEALKPFETSEELLEKTINIFKDLHQQFGKNLEAMKDAGLFDLESRKGKAPGGYNYGLETTGMPFIFMNAAGTHRNVTTLCHEGGHAMHTFLTNEEPLIHYRHAPMEMAETASMSMELFTAGRWNEFYDHDDHIRARREHLEDIISFFPWCATVDAFQHWVYLNPEHTVNERDDYFDELTRRFTSGLVNWEGYDHFRRNRWQQQLHIFGMPFYYIEYGIAQLGALQMYRLFKQDPQKALDGYIKGLRLGSSEPLPEVWKTMGIKFDFSTNTLKDLVQFVQEELKELQG
ncbi:MAG: M3 family oligoendopeptidase [Candidatus Marinimicrobia bacterium]|nr:M3 family oligoendopeptidase [Candidatus Neomarinimicrobiota bacterium]MCF7904539.1 M3 family oligoendopeptidase [Candidatus Neomarinimicrobiota bacterium]